jgi:acetyl esterase
MELEAPVLALLEQYRQMGEGMDLTDMAKVRASYVPPDLSDGPIDGVATSNVVIDSVPVRLYRPPVDGDLPLHVYFHGGAFILGSALSGESDGHLARRALDAKCLVASVEYRLAPEHRFPLGLNDCCAAVIALVADAERLGIARDAVTVGGASAGGILAAVVCVQMVQRSGPKLALQLLEVTATDMTRSSHAWRNPGLGHDITREADIAMGDVYLTVAERVHPSASPLFTADLAGVAPAYLMSAEFDPRRDECEAYATRLRDAGVQAVSRTMLGHVHGSFGIPDWEPARQWRAEANAVLAKVNAAALAGQVVDLDALEAVAA